MSLSLSRTVLQARPALSRAAVPYAVRLNSTQGTPDAKDPNAAKAAEYAAQNELRRDWDAKILTYEDVKPRTQAPSPDAYLIDVREPDEVLQGSIPSSVNLPLSGLATSLHLNATEFKAKHGFEKPKHDQEVVFYCRSGKRSASACDIAKRNGFTNISNYQGSWLDWSAKEGTSKPAS
ncbi:Rhodanese-like protein [Wolfiporia cocos MD-104 SS10]|uniref:Rhodanese-like protein n=1 Tax=Wolfiporia cocos (strain MD-104) TaxID=742152 RepID=A0A2H3JBW1_WOLCO|nr:Rhodanese-like protein [Wolfiporia cocos MD-104 SS10]